MHRAIYERPLIVEDLNNDFDFSPSEVHENLNSSESPVKKVRVSSSSVHLEFDQKKEKGAWTSKCKHCVKKETIYRHNNSSGLLIHLQKKHPAVHKKCVEDDRKERSEKEKQRSEKYELEATGRHRSY